MTFEFLPSLEIQEQIKDDINEIENKHQIILGEIELLFKNITDVIVSSKRTVPISSIVELRKEKIEPQKFPDIEFNYLGLEHMESNTGIILQWKPLKGQALESTKNVFKKGDILYGKLRPYLNKVYIAEFDGICSTDVLVLKTSYAKVLKYTLLSDAFVKQSSALMKGVSLPRLQVSEFLQFHVPFPEDKFYEVTLEKIEKLEKQISVLETQLSEIDIEIEAIFKKYL